MTTSSPASDPTETIARRLARFVVGLRFEDLGADTVRQAKALVLDQLACQLVGSTMPWVSPALDLVRLSAGAAPESTVVNSGLRLQIGRAHV